MIRKSASDRRCTILLLTFYLLCDWYIRPVKPAPYPERSEVFKQLISRFEQKQAACLQNGADKFVLIKRDWEIGGFGNQIPVHVTGFVLALLTDRCFFSDSAIFLHLLASHKQYAYSRFQQKLLELDQAVKGHSIINPATAEALATLIQKNQTALYWESQAVVYENEWDYSAPFLLANPYHQDLLLKAFPKGDMFWAVTSYLLQPLPSVVHAVDSFKAAHFRKLNIGLQIRRRKCMLDCIHPPCHYEAIPGHAGCAHHPEVANYASVAKALQIARGVPDQETAFFVATDEAHVYAEIASMLGSSNVIWRADSGVDELVNGAGDPGSFQSGLTDLMLLSECQELVTTGASSFGGVAAGWGGISPVVMLPGPHVDIDNPFWYKSLTSEPCLAKGFSLMADGNLVGKLNEEAAALWRKNPFWTQYLQGHNSLIHNT